MQASITTYEWSETGLPQWVPVVTHVFHGRNKKQIKQIIEAHKQTDEFFAGSFKGKWKGFDLTNSSIKFEG